MKTLFCAVIAAAFSLSSSFAANAPANVRTIANLPGFPMQALKRMVSNKFYRSLMISPVDGWVVVSGHLVSGGRFTGARVTHSEMNGAYDALAMALAKDFTVSGFTNTDRQMAATTAQVHLLLYKIADGTMAVSIPVSGESGGDQLFYYGSAWLAVQGKDGKWTEIKGPQLKRR